MPKNRSRVREKVLPSQATEVRRGTDAAHRRAEILHEEANGTHSQAIQLRKRSHAAHMKALKLRKEAQAVRARAEKSLRKTGAK